MIYNVNSNIQFWSKIIELSEIPSKYSFQYSIRENIEFLRQHTIIKFLIDYQ